MRWRLLLLSAWIALGCGGPVRTGTRPDSKPGADPVSHVEVVISGLSRSDAEAFRGQILAQGDISDVVLKSYANKVATYELDVRGCECDLPAKIDRIRSIGLTYEGRTSRLKYKAFDNKPPVVSFEHPEDGRVLTEPEQLVAVEVRDSDIDEVYIDGQKADRFQGNVYLRRLVLKVGENKITAYAKDKAGLTSVVERVTVTLKPQSNEATLRVIVEGKVAVGSTVMIDGKEVHVDSKGKYRAEVPVRASQVEIIAIAPDGKKTVTVKDISPSK